MTPSFPSTIRKIQVDISEDKFDGDDPALWTCMDDHHEKFAEWVTSLDAQIELKFSQVSYAACDNNRWLDSYRSLADTTLLEENFCFFKDGFVDMDGGERLVARQTD